MDSFIVTLSVSGGLILNNSSEEFWAVGGQARKFLNTKSSNHPTIILSYLTLRADPHILVRVCVCVCVCVCVFPTSAVPVLKLILSR